MSHSKLQQVVRRTGFSALAVAFAMGLGFAAPDALEERAWQFTHLLSLLQALRA